MESIILITVLGIIVVFLVLLVLIYNSLVRARTRAAEAWSDIDVQLKRRYDLIPNLVETVKGYATHERELFEKVTEARSRAMGATSLKEKGDAENMLSQTLKSLFAVAENYPTLRASENFAKLQDELSDTENKIQAARRFYNGLTRDYNIKLQIFPHNVIAGMLGFVPREFFQTEGEDERAPVKVKFT